MFRLAKAKARLLLASADSSGIPQLVGEADAVRQGAVLDGYSPEEAPLPQVEYSVTIHVDRVLEFRHAPHTDAEITFANAPRS